MVARKSHLRELIRNCFCGTESRLRRGVNQVLLSATLTNPINSASCSSVFTNYDVASGYTEKDYEYKIRDVLNQFTKISKTISWRNVDGSLPNRYGTNYVHEIADTNLFGSLRPTSVVTDTLANASAAIHFTNLNYSANVLPWGASYATSTNTDYRKDTWRGTTWQTSWDTGTVVCICDSYSWSWLIPGLEAVVTCDSYTTHPTLDCGNALVVSEWADDALAREVLSAQAAVAAGANFVVMQDYPSTFGWGDSCYPNPWGAWVYSPLQNPPPGYPSISCLSNVSTCVICGNGDGYISTNICYNTTSYSFWHGAAPTNFSFCCEQDGVVYAGVATWTLIASNLTDSGTELIRNCFCGTESRLRRGVITIRSH